MLSFLLRELLPRHDKVLANQFEPDSLFFFFFFFFLFCRCAVDEPGVTSPNSNGIRRYKEARLLHQTG